MWFKSSAASFSFLFDVFFPVEDFTFLARAVTEPQTAYIGLHKIRWSQLYINDLYTYCVDYYTEIFDKRLLFFIR